MNGQDGNTIQLGEKAVLLTVSAGKFGNSRKVPRQTLDDNFEVDASKEMLGVHKKLLNCDELQAIGAFDGITKKRVQKYALPFRKGIYLIPNELIPFVNEYLEERAEERARLVQAFLDVYPEKCEEVKRELRILFEPRNYPPVERVARRFFFEWDYDAVSGTLPSQVAERISSDALRREKEKKAAMLRDAVDDARDALAEGMQKLVSHMISRLQPDEDGKPKRFDRSVVSNFKEFLAIFDARNISGDKDLRDAAEQARRVLEGIDVQEVKTSDTLRESISRKMSDIGDKLAAVIQVRPGRVIHFEMDEAA